MTYRESAQFIASFDVPYFSRCVHTACGYFSTFRIKPEANLRRDKNKVIASSSISTNLRCITLADCFGHTLSIKILNELSPLTWQFGRVAQISEEKHDFTTVDFWYITMITGCWNMLELTSSCSFISDTKMEEGRQGQHKVTALNLTILLTLRNHT